MKVPALLLTALSAAVLTSCEKSDVKPTTDDNQQTPNNETVLPATNNPEQPYYCPACGMG